MDRRSFLVGAGGGAAVLAPASLILRGQTRPGAIPATTPFVSSAVTNWCAGTARTLATNFNTKTARQADLSRFIDAHIHLGIPHLKEAGVIDQATAWLVANRNNFPMNATQIAQARSMFTSYCGAAPSAEHLARVPLAIDAVLDMGLDVAAIQVLKFFQQQAAPILPAQDINQMQQIANTLMVTGAFWGLGAFIGCVVCGVGGAILGIGGLFLCWVYC